jgi:putative sugar O-methyltransferase
MCAIMSLGATLRRAANQALSPFHLQIVRKKESETDVLSEEPPPVLPAEAQSYLQWTNPVLESLRRRYASHPASVHSQWSREFISQKVDLRTFRADNAFVWQGRQFRDHTYLLTAYYAQMNDHLRIFNRLTEDGMFSPYTFRFNGKLISRDLIDSVLEINFLHECLGDQKLSLLDIGAGYGRLGHRLSEVAPNVSPVYCTDAIPESTFICDYYLKFRQANAHTVPLDEVEALVKKGGIDIATNIHSFSECTRASISWWLSLLREGKVKYLLIVPNRSETLLSTEANGARLDFSDLIAQAGYRLKVKRPKFSDATAMGHYGLGPTWNFLFSLDN